MLLILNFTFWWTMIDLFIASIIMISLINSWWFLLGNYYIHLNEIPLIPVSYKVLAKWQEGLTDPLWINSKLRILFLVFLIPLERIFITLISTWWIIDFILNKWLSELKRTEEYPCLLVFLKSIFMKDFLSYNYGLLLGNLS